MPRNSFLVLLSLAIAAPLSAAMIFGPERMAAPPNLGVPPTSDVVVEILPEADGFVVFSTSDGHPLAQHLDASGRRLGGPQALGISFAPEFVGSDTQRYLVASRAHVALLDEHFAAITNFTLLDASEVTGVHWTGNDYLLVYVSTARTLRAIRVSRDGLPASQAIDIAADTSYDVASALDDDDVVIGVRLEPHQDNRGPIRVIRITPTNDVTDVVELPGPYVSHLQVAVCARTIFLLADGLYRIGADSTAQIIDGHVFAPETAATASITSTEQALVLFDVRGSQLVAKSFDPTGAVLQDWRPLFDVRLGNFPYLKAAAAHHVVVFTWSESLSSDNDYDIVVATIDAALTQTRADGVPDGVLLSPGASYRREPSIAIASSATLVVWLEHQEGESWIAGAVMKPDGTRTYIEISPHDASQRPRVATDGQKFFVVWTATDGSISGRSVHPDGTVDDIRTMANTPAADPAIAFNAGSYVLAWNEPTTARDAYYVGFGTHVYAERFDRQGVAIDPAPRLIAGPPASPTASKPSIASDGARLLIGWTEGAVCYRLDCIGHEDFLDIRGDVFNEELLSVSGPFTIANDFTNETDVTLAWSGQSWLAAWTAWIDLLGHGTPVFLSDSGFAVLSPRGTIVAEYYPHLVDPLQERIRVAGVAWKGSQYFIVSIGDRLHLTSMTETGGIIEVNAPDVRVSGAALAASPVGMVLSYSRPAPEFGIGTADQVFLRDIGFEAGPRRRAASH